MSARALSNEDVLAIRRAVHSDPKANLKAIAEQYGVTRYTIYYVVTGHQYKDVGGPTVPDLMVRRAFGILGPVSIANYAKHHGRVKNSAPARIADKPLAETWF